MSHETLSELIPIKDWGLPYSRFALAAGPCSAESPDQLMAAARAMKDAGCPLSFFRTGIWKPRTHPGSFEGHGSAALPWLQQVREETGFPVGTEVAEPAHVQACLDHGIDVLWLGARTTPNPFAVQAIADCLRGVDIPVLIKNPVSPDLGLWVGAVERLYRSGLRRIAVIHRGFAVAETQQYRNPPLWRIPIELKRRFPGLPIICDPSHMCGRVDLIGPVAQEAMDLLYEGLMLEVHHDPAHALSDALQQLTPTQFVELIRSLETRHEFDPDRQFQTRIHQLRGEIDQVDGQIMDMLRKRMDIVQAIGECKRSREVSTLQPERWREMVALRMQQGTRLGFSAEFLQHLYAIIHEEAIQWQERPLFNGKE